MYTRLVAACACVRACVCVCEGTKDIDNETLVVCVDPMMQRSGYCVKCAVKVHTLVSSEVSHDQSSVAFELKIK